MKYLGVLIALAFVPTLAGAQSLDECQQLARENYPLIKRYGLIRQTTDFTIGNISKGWLPQVSASAQATVQSDVTAWPGEMKTMLQQFGVDIPGMKKEQYRIGIDVDQTVWDGGRIKSQKGVARVQGDVQTAQADVDIYAVRQRVNDLYFGILLLDEKIRLNKDLRDLLESNLNKLNAMLRNGVAMESDVNSVEAEKLKAEQQATELAASRQSLARMLGVFVGRERVEPVKPSVATASYIAGQNRRPELRFYDNQIRLADAQERLLAASLRPRLSVFAQGFYGYPGYNMFEAMMNRDWTLNGMVGARITWNIGSLYTNKNDRAKLQLQREQAENAREIFLFNNNLLQIQQNEGIEKYRKLLDEDERIVELRSQVRRSAESKLAHGIIDTNNLLQEITRENQAKTDRQTHEVEMLKEIHDLKYTTNN